jgi:hypothetical protein
MTSNPDLSGSMFFRANQGRKSHRGPGRNSFIEKEIYYDCQRLLTFICVLTLPSLVCARAVTTAIDQALGRSGQKTGNLHAAVHGLAIKHVLALSSWAAFLGTDDNAMVMGDWFCLRAS